MKKQPTNNESKCYIPVPLDQYLKDVDDYYILESLSVFKLKKRWNINNATIALRDACIKEWQSRHGMSSEIPEVEISPEAKELLESEI